MLYKKMIVFSFLIHMFLPCYVFCEKYINLGENALDKIYSYNIIGPQQPVRLHLGCGCQKFRGYVNIDFPPSEHTVQTRVAADVFADISTLHFPENTVDEVRSHHVFEHFDRPTALGLLVKWMLWLKIGGTLVIETPDFDGCIDVLKSGKFPYKKQQAIIRHIFGSHEASWAIHCDGWYEEKFQTILSALGFEEIMCRHSNSGGYLPNITVRAVKKKDVDISTLRSIVGSILKDSLVVSTETSMFNVWMKLFDNLISCEVK